MKKALKNFAVAALLVLGMAACNNMTTSKSSDSAGGSGGGSGGGGGSTSPTSSSNNNSNNNNRNVEYYAARLFFWSLGTVDSDSITEIRPSPTPFASRTGGSYLDDSQPVPGVYSLSTSGTDADDAPMTVIGRVEGTILYYCLDEWRVRNRGAQLPPSGRIPVNSFELSCCVGGVSRSFSSLQVLDLSGFSFAEHESANLNHMIRFDIRNCPNLQTIYVSSNYVRPDTVYVNDNMFSGCTSLVGGAGTTYAASRLGATYARIDGGTANPGYFTAK